MAEAVIRPGVAADQPAIKAIVHQTGINPMGLDWRRFLVAVDEGQIVGIGQVRPHADGSRELASIAVIPERQRQGIATAIIQALLARETGPLYLICRRERETFYMRFGFRGIEVLEMPAYFRRIWRLAMLSARVTSLVWGETRLIIMKRDQASS